MTYLKNFNFIPNPILYIISYIFHIHRGHGGKQSAFDVPTLYNPRHTNNHRFLPIERHTYDRDKVTAFFRDSLIYL